MVAAARDRMGPWVLGLEICPMGPARLLRAEGDGGQSATVLILNRRRCSGTWTTWSRPRSASPCSAAGCSGRRPWRGTCGTRTGAGWIEGEAPSAPAVPYPTGRGRGVPLTSSGGFSRILRLRERSMVGASGSFFGLVLRGRFGGGFAHSMPRATMRT